jgi:hypothetical protein
MCPFFWVIPRGLNFMCRRFGTHCLFHLHRSCEQEFTLPTKIEQAVIPKRWHLNSGPKERIQHSQQRRKFETRKVYVVCAIPFLGNNQNTPFDTLSDIRRY